MFKNPFANKIKTNSKTAILSSVLLANAFIWYFYSIRFLTEIIANQDFSDSAVLFIWGFNILGIAVAAIFGVFVVFRFKKRVTFLLYWTIAGVILSLVPLAVDITGFNALLVFSTFVGVYFGLGMPVSMGYYAAATEAANRARFGGVTFLLAFLGVFLLRGIGLTDIALNALVLAGCKIASFVIIVVAKPDEKEIAGNDRTSYRSIFRNKPFLLYFIPWIMFSIVNYLTAPIANKFFPENFSQFSTLVENVLAGVFAVVCGFLGDYIGRKRLVVGGFALMGLGYASLGMLQENIFGWWFYIVVDGIAWGAFYTIFIMTIWGDFAHQKSSEKYYAVGCLPFLFSVFMQLSIGAYVSSTVLPSAVFSFASIFLFLAVLPLAFAPETLADKIMKNREIRHYIEKAQRARLTAESGR